VPAKFEVKGADGKPDLQASAAKILESYNQLSSRLGDPDGKPPETADGYEFDAKSLGDAAKAAGVDLKDFKNDPDFQDFAKAARDAGMTNKQLNVALKSYLNMAPKLVAAANQLDTEAATKALRQVWPDEASFNGGIQAAQRAFRAYGGTDAENLMRELGNNVAVVRLMAAVGADMAEDKVPGAQSQGQNAQSQDAEIVSEMMELARDHKQHTSQYKALVARRAALYQAQGLRA
jgi:hypothetical protein